MKRAKSGGRRRGTPNRTTKVFKDAIMLTFQGIGGVRAMKTWARRNQTDFYKIAARLIPHEVTVAGGDGPPLELRIELTDALTSHAESSL